jgi:hypothetical protein
VKIGLVADSQGDVDALEYACDLLADEKGADRILFLGGRWGDVDELFTRKRGAQRGREDYGDADFLADVAAFIALSSEGAGAAGKIARDKVEKFINRFERVPDKASPQYADPAVPRVLPELIGDRIACLVHDKGDLTRDDIERAVFLIHGKSAEPGMVQIGTRFFITPGSLAKVERPSFGLLTWDEEGVQFVAFGLDGRELKRCPIQLVTRRKMSAH